MADKLLMHRVSVDDGQIQPTGLSPTRLRVTRAIMATAAVAAAAAMAASVTTVLHAESATRIVETWRMYGFALCTGLFVLLAVAPRGRRGLWELVIANKLLLTGTAAGYQFTGSAVGSGEVIVWDGLMTGLLVAGYITCRGWRRE
ncbi:peptidoglycan/LPS O-acetylase OafA/YrhL [Nakamurella sp. UYEF19]|uniref:hypothetical protein n=1 Tax=Nakamurella sp. UYEF19 TaxID=1756392 RepID=UPI00339A5C15